MPVERVANHHTWLFIESPLPATHSGDFIPVARHTRGQPEVGAPRVLAYPDTSAMHWSIPLRSSIRSHRNRRGRGLL